MRPTLPLTLLVACALSDYAVSTGLNRLKAEDEVSFTLPANWSEDIAHTPGPFSALAKADKSKSKSKIKGDRFCNVVLAGYEYDLCPIFDGKDARHPPGVRGLWLKEETPPTVKYTSYTISLKGPLAKNESRSDDLQVRILNSLKAFVAYYCEVSRGNLDLYDEWVILLPCLGI